MRLFAWFLSIHTLCGAMQPELPQFSMEEARKKYEEAVELVNNNEDLEKAEKLLLPIRNQIPDAYMALYNIAALQDSKEQTNETAQKIIDYAKEAANNGFPQSIGEIGVGYERLQKYAEAREYYEKGLRYDTADMRTHVNLAHLLWEGKGGPANTSLAVRYYQIAAKSGNKDAIFHLALAYASGIGTTPAPREAYKLYSQIIEDPSDENYPDACNDVGFMYENGMISAPQGTTNIAQAVKYFQMAKNANVQNTFGIIKGKANLARLIWTGKIPGDKEQAKKDLQECAENGDTLALYLYSAILLNEGDIEQGFQVLRTAYEGTNKPSPLMIKLQFALAYQDGWGGLPENKPEANKLFAIIRDRADDVFRSTFLTRAYLYIMGLGVEKDERKGFQLLEESKKKVDDVFLDTDELFPTLKKIEQEYIQKIAELSRQLLEEEEKEEAKKQKKKGKESSQKKSEPSQKKEEPLPKPSVVPIPTAGESSTAAASRRRQRNVFDVSLDEWNNFWAKNGDGSVISAINRNKNQIIIDDPTRNEQLIVKVTKNPYHYFDDLTELTYDPRIIKRQQEGSEEGKRNHNFAKILDYVIQCAGILGQFAKDGSDDPKDLLIATVTRVDKTTGRQIPCKAEYTFYKRHGKQYLYHRLLRPIGR